MTSRFVRPVMALVAVASSWSVAMVGAGCGDSTSADAPDSAAAANLIDAAREAAVSSDALGPAQDAPPIDASTEADAASEAALPNHATVAECFTDLVGPVAAPDYDRFAPTMGSHCAGTQHQRITGVEKVVFLGDSITSGTPPTPASKYYRQLVIEGLRQRFGPNLAVADCSAWGKRIGQLRTESGSSQLGQIEQCFPSGIETKKTLIVMTMGANDVSAWAKDQIDAQAATAQADIVGAQLGEALAWLKAPAHFPNGSYVVFGNTYEYTDTSGDLLSCATAGLSGFTASWAQGTPAVLHLQELFMQHAVATGTDLLFLLENFCGHGYRRGDPNLQCYRGPNADLWFDLTCYHPNETGHAKLAEYVLRVVDG